MSKDLKSIGLRLLAIGAAACSSVYAARSAPDVALRQEPDSPPPAASPYTIELIDEAGNELSTYDKDGRFYVLGAAGTRYSIRVSNPTDRRVEALVSVDGLDVIDGEDADFAGKRGYIVPPHDTLVVEGFRTSTSSVAAFRFSAVADSYAERKGKGRNVGVVGVAIFEEKGQPQIVVEQPTARDGDPSDPVDRWLDHEHESAPVGGGLRGSAGADKGGGAGGEAKAAPTEEGRYAGARPRDPGPAKRRMPTEYDDRPRPDSPAPPPHSTTTGDVSAEVQRDERPDPNCCGQRTSRPGLGTEYGEQRYSAVSFTRFVRNNPTKPDAIAELRYNDHDGLAALGLLVKPAYDPNEVVRRETADPFPATRFATPPR